MNLPDYITSVIDVLESNGFEAYLVGGCVRDDIMGITPHDYDMTANALPEQILACFSEQKVLTNGLRHGTVGVVFGKAVVEITTFRIDGGYFDNRHPESVEFTRDLRSDLARRDFTINAIAYSPSRGIIDVFGGKDDIENRIIRCVGEPDRRFNEDGLRIIRALRFSSVLGFDIEEKTAASIHKNAALLKNISAERIWSEFVKLVCGKEAGRILKDYSDAFRLIIPKLNEICDSVYESMARGISDSENSALVRLSVFFSVFSGFDDAENVVSDCLRKLTCDNTTKRIVAVVSANSGMHLADNEIGAQKLASEFGYSTAEILCKTIGAVRRERRDNAGHLCALLENCRKNNSCVTVGDLCIDGNDLIKDRIANGAEIGMILRKLLCDVIEQRIPNERVVLLDRARTYVGKGLEI